MKDVYTNWGKSGPKLSKDLIVKNMKKFPKMQRSQGKYPGMQELKPLCINAADDKSQSEES